MIEFNLKNKTNYIGITDQLKAIGIVDLFRLENKNIIVVLENHNKALEFYKKIEYLEKAHLVSLDNIYKVESNLITIDMITLITNSLSQIYKNDKNLIITNLDFLDENIPSENNISESEIKFKTGNNIDLKSLEYDLEQMGYRKESFVEKNGDYAIRGYILDIFPINEYKPYRIELFGDLIEKIKTFDLEEQLSLEEKNEFIVLSLFSSINKDSKLRNLENSKFIFINSVDFSVKKEDAIILSDFDNNIDGYETKKIDSEKIYRTDIDNILKREEFIKIVCFDDKDRAIKEFRNREDKINFIESPQNANKDKINILIINIIDSFRFDENVYISHFDFLGYKANPIINKIFRSRKGNLDYNKIKIGDYVVHDVHGIGKYVGIKTITKNSLEKEYLQINYRNNDKIYVPVEKLDSLYKYSAEEGTSPILSSLSSGEWQKTKILARNKAGEIAKELLESYVNKKIDRGFAFSEDDQNQIDFENDFPYEYTLDQYKVTEEIKKDMQQNIPMNRLLCGDVGFGKTEVAFRAIFKAVLSSKQVMFLCPTTILSNQHYENAKVRFRNFPVNIRLLNRFVTPKETKKIFEEIKSGKADIVIGTHKLLNKEVKFKELGLLIIDEEQRFGVKHKEVIDGIRSSIDVLSLSATPIPRTIQLTMAGVKNLSLIETPPLNRHPIQTYVCEYDEKVIGAAISKEIDRGGQVFIINNDISKMEEIKENILKIIPSSKIAIVHGQQNKSTIENVMNKFLKKDFNILIATTIVETGIDIPTVNTIIILEADKFGLSQLYQIRGRVGRSQEIAYCYLMYKKHKVISEIAEKRLKAIKDFTRLGSGYSIAMRDLSLRGAGDLLGKEQSGFISSVGVTMFMKMIDEEIKKIKGEYEDNQSESNPLIDVKTALNEFDDQDVKIKIHKLINEVTNEEELMKTYEVIKDIFGNVSPDIVTYMKQEIFEKSSARNIFSSIKQSSNKIELTLNKEIENKIDMAMLMRECYLLNSNVKVTKYLNQNIIVINVLKLDSHYIDYLLQIVKLIEKEIIL